MGIQSLSKSTKNELFSLSIISQLIVIALATLTMPKPMYWMSLKPPFPREIRSSSKGIKPTSILCKFSTSVFKDQGRSEEHTSELQSRPHLVCRLLLEKKKKNTKNKTQHKINK